MYRVGNICIYRLETICFKWDRNEYVGLCDLSPSAVAAEGDGGESGRTTVIRGRELGNDPGIRRRQLRPRVSLRHRRRQSADLVWRPRADAGRVERLSLVGVLVSSALSVPSLSGAPVLKPNFHLQDNYRWYNDDRQHVRGVCAASGRLSKGASWCDKHRRAKTPGGVT